MSQERPRLDVDHGVPQAPEPEAVMPLYRLEVKVVSRGKQGATMVRGAAYRSGSRLREYEREPGSAVASAAHLAGTRLEDEREGVVHDFRGKAVEHAEVMLPPGAPETFRDRETLWNAAEAAETRINSRVGRGLLVVLPRELGDAENLELVRDFVRESSVGRGMCADLAVHAPTASDGLKQPHAHILTSVREVGPDGFGAKVREWDKRELVTSLRREWADACNLGLERAGREERVDHRSLREQHRDALERGDFDAAARLDREPGVHLGPAAHAMEREGLATDLGDTLREIAELNAHRAAAYEHVRELGPEAQRAFLAERERADFFDAFDRWAEVARERMEHWLERVEERVRDVAEHVAGFAHDAVERVTDLGEWLVGLGSADSSELDAAREELREHELAHEEREALEHELDEMVRGTVEEREHEWEWDRGREEHER